MTTELPHVDSPAAVLRHLLQVPSVTGQEARFATQLRQLMSALGYRVRIDDVGNVVGELGPAGGGPTIMLLGHLDTVPGQLPVRQVGDRLYGRGAVDAKGPLLAMVYAAARAATGTPARFVVVGAVEEEGTSRGAHHLLRGSPPDALVIGEPSGVRGVVVGYKGLLSVDYQVHRPAHHTSGPQENAVEVAADVWRLVHQRLAGQAGGGALFDAAVPALVALHGDTTQARARINCRLPAGFDDEGFLSWLREVARGGTVTIRERVPAVRTKLSDPVVRALSAAVRERAGGPPVLKVKLGTSDMNVVVPRWRVPVAAYGPGDSHLDHADDEHIEIPEFLLAIEVLATALPRLASLLRQPATAAGARAGSGSTAGSTGWSP